ncbi:MAG: Ureidoglycolate hydrolase [Leptolyngbya foveolarum]|uniref:Ureidoglycolate hydrolase n=1 Tax=Leptolyngbya foveolarum TaxID=47253 RepID=A0A2W4W4M9_9CYAN|nr:MAG: Ureidoglycolate hydrolase [Leptolyngbya foveolarum]
MTTALFKSPVAVRSLPAIPITEQTFRPFGQVIYPQPDSKGFDFQDAQLQLQNGIPRFYIMQIHQRGRQFHHITRHNACTQCLGSLEGQTWFLGVALASDRPQPKPENIQVFQIPGNCFVKLEIGTWHAGPYFDADTVSFYNLELSDTNIVDHTTCDLRQTYDTIFEIVSEASDMV